MYYFLDADAVDMRSRQVEEKAHINVRQTSLPAIIPTQASCGRTCLLQEYKGSALACMTPGVDCRLLGRDNQYQGVLCQVIDNLLVHRQVGCDDGRLPSLSLRLSHWLQPQQRFPSLELFARR